MIRILNRTSVLAMVTALALLVAFILWRRGSSTVFDNPSTLPGAAQKAIDQGREAGYQAANEHDPVRRRELWEVAIQDFDVARKTAPLTPEALYFLGSAEAQVRGRELRAICWLEAYLALIPHGEKATKARAIIDNELFTKVQSNLKHIETLLKEFADKMDFPDYRKFELESVDGLERRETHLSEDVAEDFEGYIGWIRQTTPPQEVHFSPVFATWASKRWIALVDQGMNTAMFTDFDRAINNAAEGHALNASYLPDYRPQRLIPAFLARGATSAQDTLEGNFESVMEIGQDMVAAMRDIANTREILKRLQPALGAANVKSISGPYLCASAFSDGVAAVSNSPNKVSDGNSPFGYPEEGDRCTSGWGFIDRNGTFVVPPDLDKPDRRPFPEFHEGLLRVNGFDYVKLVRERNEWQRAFGTSDRATPLWGFIDKSGTTVIRPQWEDVRDFSEGLAAVTDGHKWGFIDTSGKVRIPLSFDETQDFSEGLAAVSSKSEKRVTVPNGSGGSLEACVVEKHWYYIDKSGNIVLPPTSDWDDVGLFSEGLAPVKKGGKWGFINKSGHMILPPKWDDVNGNYWRAVEQHCGKPERTSAWIRKPFSDGLAAVENGDKWTLINKSGDIINPSVTFSHRPTKFSGGIALVGVPDEFLLVDSKGSVREVPPPLLSVRAYANDIFQIPMSITYRGNLDRGEGFIEIVH